MMHHPTPMVPRLQAREAVRARQVLLDFDDLLGPEAGVLLGGSITVLKDRLDEVLQESDGEAQVPHKTRTVLKLRNRGILIELDSDRAAEWFTQDHIWQNLAQRLHSGLSIKQCLFHAVAQFIPLTFQLEKESDLHEVEGRLMGSSQAALPGPIGLSPLPDGHRCRCVATRCLHSFPQRPLTRSCPMGCSSARRRFMLRNAKRNCYVASSVMDGGTWPTTAQPLTTSVGPAHSITRPTPVPMLPTHTVSHVV